MKVQTEAAGVGTLQECAIPAASKGGEPRAAIAAVLASMVLVVLDAGIANVALPTISGAMQVSPSKAVWVVTAYQAALVMGLLPCAAWGDHLGHRRVFTFGVALFAVASALCACAPSLQWLVAARFVQGLGGSAVMALGIALLRAVVPHHRLGAAIGWNALAVALSSAAGPTIGALILTGWSWHWLFALNLPLGAAVLWAARALPVGNGSGQRLDRFSAALNAGSLASLVIGAELLLHAPVLAAVMIVAAASGLAVLVRRELPKKSPLVPLDLLRSRPFRISVLASVSCFAGTTAGLMALPFYLQHSLGQSALMTGLYLTPWPLTVAVAAPLAGRLSDRVSSAWLCVTGAALLTVGLAAAALLRWEGQAHLLVAMTVVCGLGFGLFQVPNNRNMLLSAPLHRSGAAGGMQGTARLMGQTAGSVIASLLFGAVTADMAPKLSLGIAAALTSIAAVISLMRTGGCSDPTSE
ncbi:MFS transporter [Variovorax defluvii]|uniref:MFS transporter n=2 Tax=Variovorax defluvii TaxID=913761 RepID=A0ABP8HU13_9BURK